MSHNLSTYTRDDVMKSKDKFGTKGWFVNHKVRTVILAFMVLIVIISIASGGSKPAKNNQANTATTTSSSKATTPSKSQPVKKASYEATLYNIADDNNISMTFPSGGWDSNAGWDTAAQASADDANTSAVTPAVVELNTHQLQLSINVKNTGNAAGSPSCTVKASSETGSNFDAGKYYGTNYVNVTALNGGPIQPGDYGNATDTVTITGQGALYIRQIKISC
jgi:cytoskeletal protein RodZ